MYLLAALLGTKRNINLQLICKAVRVVTFMPHMQSFVHENREEKLMRNYLIFLTF